MNLDTLSTLNNEPVFDLHDVTLVEIAARVKRHYGSRVIANDEASHALKEIFSAARQSLHRTLKGTSKIWCLQRTSLNIQGRTEAAWQEPSIEDSGQIDKKAMIPWSDLMQTPSGSKCAGDTEES